MHQSCGHCPVPHAGRVPRALSPSSRPQAPVEALSRQCRAWPWGPGNPGVRTGRAVTGHMTLRLISLTLRFPVGPGHGTGSFRRLRWTDHVPLESAGRGPEKPHAFYCTCRDFSAKQVFPNARASSWHQVRCLGTPVKSLRPQGDHAGQRRCHCPADRGEAMCRAANVEAALSPRRPGNAGGSSLSSCLRSRECRGRGMQGDCGTREKQCMLPPERVNRGQKHRPFPQRDEGGPQEEQRSTPPCPRSAGKQRSVGRLRPPALKAVTPPPTHLCFY